MKTLEILFKLAVLGLKSSWAWLWNEISLICLACYFLSQLICRQQKLAHLAFKNAALSFTHIHYFPPPSLSLSQTHTLSVSLSLSSLFLSTFKTPSNYSSFMAIPWRNFLEDCVKAAKLRIHLWHFGSLSSSLFPFPSKQNTHSSMLQSFFLYLASRM